MKRTIENLQTTVAELRDALRTVLREYDRVSGELALAMERSSSENASEPDHSEVTFTGQSLLTAAAAQECKVEELQIISLHGSQEVQDSELIELSGLCELAAVDLSDTSVTGAMQA